MGTVPRPRPAGTSLFVIFMLATQVLNRGHVKMVVWERGCGITQACGTGACALVVASVLAGLTDRKCTVTLPGGDLQIEWRESDGKVYMTGPAELAFQGDAVVR